MMPIQMRSPSRLRGDDDLRHSRRQLLKRRSFIASRLSKSLRRPLPGAGIRIQDFEANAAAV